MFRNTNSPQIHGLQAVSNQILVRKPPGCEPRPAGHPAALVIYGWDDCLPRHVAKYAEGLQSLYPRSREIVILALISKAMFSGTKSRSKHMAAVIDNFSNVFTKKANGKASADSSYDTDDNSGDPLHPLARNIQYWPRQLRLDSQRLPPPS